MGKKYRERIEREKNIGWYEQVRKTFLFKIFIFSAKALAVTIFVCYLALGATMTYGWTLTKWYRHYPVSYASQLCKKYAMGQQPQPGKITDWMAARDVSEAEAIMKKLEPCTPYLPSVAFLTFSNWKYTLGKMEEGLNWRQYARFRARFDALRCGSFDAGDTFNNILDMGGREEVQEMMERNPSLQPKSIVWALEYDAKFPPPQNDPSDICRQLTSVETGRFKIVPRSDWVGIHDTLRAISYYYVQLMEADIKRGGRGVIDIPSIKLPEDDTPEKDKKEEKEKPEKEKSEKESGEKDKKKEE